MIFVLRIVLCRVHYLKKMKQCPFFTPDSLTRHRV
jgi:hypothetical protein